MVDEAVDGRGGGHRVLEDPIPLPEHEVAGDEQRAPLVALGHQGEEHLHLVGALLHVADVIEDEQLEGIESLQGTWQSEVPLGCEELLDEAEGRREEDGVAAANERVTERGSGVRLAASRESEAEDVVRALEELAGRELVEFVVART